MALPNPIAATQTDADSPLDQALMDAIRLDLVDLDSRLSQIGVPSSGNIYDDFHQAALDTDNWIDTGTASPGLTGHRLFFSHTSSQSIAIVGSDKRIRFSLGSDHHIRMKCRWGKATSSGDQSVLIGFQDATVTGSSVVIDTNNIIAFVRGTNANTIKAVCAKAGASVTVANNLGNWTNWLTLEIEITFIGATKKVEFFLDGASVGSTTDTTKIPTVAMRPACGDAFGGGSRTSELDYAMFFWAERPLSA